MTYPITFLGVLTLLFTLAFFVSEAMKQSYTKYIIKMKKPKVLILGHGRHGKDSVAEIMRDKYGFSFSSSSYKAAEIFIFDRLKGKFGYKTFEECYEDRNSSNEKRALWHDLICEYNREDPTRLAKDILATTDCYVGMRSSREITACLKKQLFDVVIYVDASDRLPLEPEGSFDIDVSEMYNQGLVDFTINNNLHDPKLKLVKLQIKQMMRQLF